MQDQGLKVDQRKCVLICVDEAACMVGCHSGVSVRCKIGKLAYLADIFSRLNDRSNFPQGYCINIFTVSNKILKKVNFL